MKGIILDSSNDFLKVSPLAGTSDGAETFSALPLGTPSDTPSGEVALKVHVVSGGSAPPSFEEVVAASTVSTNGSVAAGALSVAFSPSDDFNGTIAGVDPDDLATLQFSAQPGSTLGAIAYTRTAGTLTIFTTRLP